MSKLNYKRTLLLGFGFFAVSVTWSVYNAFMPKILSQYIKSAAVIGFIMTIDNYFGLFLQPAVGVLSDRVNTKYGKRMPFVMVGMPLATLFIILLANHWNLTSLIIFLVCMNLSMSIFRSPVISLMPDLTPIENRSKANSVINFMGGIGALIAYFIGAILWDKNRAYPFYLAGILVILSFVILFNFIKEKRDVIEYYRDEEQQVGFFDGLKASGNSKSVMFLALSILSWFIGYNGIETFFTLYGEHYLKVSTGAAAMSFTFISLSFLIFAIPSGYIGTKAGKKTTIKYGVIGMIMCLFTLCFVKSILIVRVLFVFSGFFWALININSYPLITDMAPKGQIGTYTGIYYVFSSLAAIISPPLLGIIIDAVGYRYMFLYSFVFFVMALIFIIKVKIKQL